MPLLDAAGAAAMARTGVLVDARLRSDFVARPSRSTSSPAIFPARAICRAANREPDGTFLAPDALRARYAEAGILTGQPVASTAAPGGRHRGVFTLGLAGIDASLYPGRGASGSPTRTGRSRSEVRPRETKEAGAPPNAGSEESALDPQSLANASHGARGSNGGYCARQWVVKQSVTAGAPEVR